MSNVFKWFIGGEHQYKPMLTCFDGDTTTAKILAGISLSVFVIFILIAHSWWRDEKIAPPGDATKTLRTKKWIFILAAFAGFGLTALQMLWPLYRIKIIVMIPLVYLSGRFLISGGFKNVYVAMAKVAEDDNAPVELRKILDNLPIMAWTARADGYINFYNARWYDYTGTTLKEMEGWGWQRCHHPDELPKVMAMWQKCIATGTPFEMTFPLKSADGIYRWFLTRCMPTKDASGKVLRWYGSNTDADHLYRNRLQSNILLEINDRLNALQSRAEMATKC